MISFIKKGIDTSDASATVNDVLYGKTAYVDGEKIIGNMINNGDVTITPTTTQQNKEQGYYNSLIINGVDSSIDENIMPENIKSGVSILGQIGTFNGNVKLFSSVEDMQADSNPQDGDLAVVYYSTPAYMEPNQSYESPLTLKFPETVIFDNTPLYESNDNWIYNIMDTITYELTNTSFTVKSVSERGNRPGSGTMTKTIVSYMSTDGLTYSRTNDTKEYILQRMIHIKCTNADICKFFQVGVNYVFNGLYQYQTKEVEGTALGYKNPKVIDEILTYDNIENFDYSNVLPIIEQIENSANSYGRYIVVIKADGSINVYDMLDGIGTYYDCPGIICDGSKIFIGQDYSSQSIEDFTFRKHIIDIENNTYSTQTLSKSTYDYQTVAEELSSNDIIIPFNTNLSDSISVDFFGTNDHTSPTNLNRVDVPYHVGLSTKYYIASSQLTATSNDLVQGKIAYGKGGIFTGTLEILDTSDADATADDIAEGKTAYINGEKITGTLDEPNDVDSRVIIDNEHSTYIIPDNMAAYFPGNFGELARSSCIAYEGVFVDTSDFIVRKNNLQYIYTILEKSRLATDIGLTADKIVSGNTILDVVGTASIGTTPDTTIPNNEYGLENATSGELDNDIGIKLFTNANTQSKLYEVGSIVEMHITNELLAQVLGITADKIKSGEVICGIEGTYTGNSSIVEEE